MLKSNTSRGFTLIETVVAISLLSILLFYIVSFKVSCKKTNIRIKNKAEIFDSFEIVCKDLEYNCNFQDILYLMENNLLYLPRENFHREILREKSLISLLSNEDNKSILKLTINRDEVNNMITINVKSDIKNNNDLSSLEKNIYKGEYFTN
ncbi:hypothetical protein SH2C18_05030 [Clostridium sediminicola]|uniref:PulJ/GspJ family protein n=1 Tax=Clostridium sediminicola TaxID=3114879 RepID=UPI0031F21F13